jgi:hypothetical protein
MSSSLSVSRLTSCGRPNEKKRVWTLKLSRMSENAVWGETSFDNICTDERSLTNMHAAAARWW